MHHRLYPVALLVLVVAALIVSGCSGRDPGPLTGTWRVAGIQRTTISFRPGEVEANGTVDQVRYEQVGMDVNVTYETGAYKGRTVRFTITGPSSATSEFGAMSRRAR